MKNVVILLALIGFSLAADPADEAFIWDIGGNIHGTAAQVAKQINPGVEDAWLHFADADSAVKQAQSQLDSQTDATLKSVHDSAAYKSKSAELGHSQADLKKARDSGDAAQAVQVGGVVNQAKTDLAAMEKKAIANDLKLPQDQTALNQAIRKRMELKAALNKAAEWRGRIVHGIKFGALLTSPLIQEQEFWIDSVRVHDADPQTLTLEMQIRREVPGSTKKNARGDGLDVAMYETHPIHVIIPRPQKCTADAGSTVAIKATYKLSGDFDNTGRLPAIHAEPDLDGKLAVLLLTVAAVKGPDKAYLYSIDDAVDKKEQKELEKIDAHHGR